jgi:hypothetical protein
MKKNNRENLTGNSVEKWVEMKKCGLKICGILTVWTY